MAGPAFAAIGTKGATRTNPMAKPAAKSVETALSATAVLNALDCISNSYYLDEQVEIKLNNAIWTPTIVCG